LEQFFVILSRKESQINKDLTILLPLPDESLTQMQMETVKNHNNLITKLQDEVNTLKISVKDLESEIARQEDYIMTLQEEHG
jgi:predicted RNase H-like nuclease (RuvC/YqgF family)